MKNIFRKKYDEIKKSWNKSQSPKVLKFKNITENQHNVFASKDMRHI